MRAAVLTAPGVPVLGTLPEPVATDGKIVLDVLAAPINGIDRVAALGRHPLSPPVYPAIAGYDGVGQTGDGRLVYFHYFNHPVPPFGAMAEHPLVDPADLVPLPEDADPVVAAVLGNASVAGWLPLSWRAGLAAGETVCILGAAGVVGSVALQAARLLGAGSVVAVVRGPRQVARALDLGATTVIDSAAHPDAADLTAALQAAAPRGFDVVLDYLWGEVCAAAIHTAAPRARVVLIGAVTGDALALSNQLLHTRGINLLGFAGYLAPPELVRQVYLDTVRLATLGQLHVEAHRVPLVDVEHAWTSHGPARTVLVP